MNQYLDQKDIIEYLLATDVYVTPYLDPNQITSGTLSYALGAGKAVVSTPYLHAQEALAKDRGILVDFRSAESDRRGRQRDPGRPQAQGAAGEERLRLRERGNVAEDRRAVPRRRCRSWSTSIPMAPDAQATTERPLQIAHRLAGNPLIRPERPRAVAAGVRGDRHDQPRRGARSGDETVLLVRVVERPRRDIELDGDAHDDRPVGSSAALDAAARAACSPTSWSAWPTSTTTAIRRGVVIGYVPRDLPGLDLSDPRTIRYRNSAGGFTPGQDEFTDYLSHISHLRVARSPDGEHFTLDRRARSRRRTRSRNTASKTRGSRRSTGCSTSPTWRSAGSASRPPGCPRPTSARSSGTARCCSPTRRTSCCSPRRWTGGTSRSRGRCPGRSVGCSGCGSPRATTSIALGRPPPGRGAAARHVGRDADRRVARPDPDRRGLARALPRRRPR